MVASVDLKPLSEETIAQMGYNNHDLWMVKIGANVFGPFESESLKHYVSDNEALFETAQASRADEKEWKPFWAHTQFQRRKPQVVQSETHEGPYWVMDMGLKTGPFNFRDIDKKIEMGLLVMTDYLSVDNGQSWVKIYEIEGFDRRSHTPDDLPIAPYESSFQKAKLALVEKMEVPHVNTVDEIAEMAWNGQQNAKVIQFRMEEMTLNQQKYTEVSPTLKWAVPTAAAFVMTMMISGYFIFSVEEDIHVAQETAEEKPFYKKKIVKRTHPVVPKAVMPAPQPVIREPASVSYPKPQPSYNQGASRYPTHVETHQDDYREPEQAAYPERDPLDGPVTDMEVRAEEHSLVDNQQMPVEHQSADAGLDGGEPPPFDPSMEMPMVDQPVVEEVSDF